FERFWRADPSRARESGGAGLGLAIVSAITEAHGGTAEVVTAPGEGATFRIRIPRDRPAPTEPESETEVDLQHELLPEAYFLADAAPTFGPPSYVRVRQPVRASGSAPGPETRTTSYSETRTTSLPRWSPVNRRTSASGARSRPSSTCSRNFSFPCAR